MGAGQPKLMQRLHKKALANGLYNGILIPVYKSNAFDGCILMWESAQRAEKGYAKRMCLICLSLILPEETCISVHAGRDLGGLCYSLERGRIGYGAS